MRLISVNCGLPRQVEWQGRVVTAGIYKQPMQGRVALRKLSLEGDCQADLSVHGGEAKAVYCYPAAHFDYWAKELAGRQLSMGMFGENFTTDGLSESTVFLGDILSIGSAEVVVTQPRFPCYKLGLRFKSDDMVRRFLASGRTGFYLAVTREGNVAAGDKIARVGLTRLYIAKKYSGDDLASLKRVMAVAAVPESWKDYFRERLDRAKA